MRDQLLMLQVAGWALRGDLDDAASALFALLRGYLLQWLEDGPAALQPGGVEQFKRFIAAQFYPPPGTQPSA